VEVQKENCLFFGRSLKRGYPPMPRAKSAGCRAVASFQVDIINLLFKVVITTLILSSKHCR
jgi:hypothetical protein